jgi:hypothetical protein
MRTAVRKPIPARGPEAVCRYHRRLAEALEPGDYVINFNWDSLMADALLFHSPLWFPRAGFGRRCFLALMATHAKAHNIDSLVQLYHIHGSVLLYELLEVGPESKGTQRLVYVGPPGYPDGNSLASLLKTGPEQQTTRLRKPSDAEYRAVTRGYLHFQDRWFRPMFVPPSYDKGEYRHWYHRALRTAIHGALPSTETFVIVGYSAPAADIEHLSSIFVSGIIRPDARVAVVNRSAAEPEFQERIRRLFPTVREIEFGPTDFKAWSADLLEPGWRPFI